MNCVIVEAWRDLVSADRLKHARRSGASLYHARSVLLSPPSKIFCNLLITPRTTTICFSIQSSSFGRQSVCLYLIYHLYLLRNLLNQTRSSNLRRRAGELLITTFRMPKLLNPQRRGNGQRRRLTSTYSLIILTLL